MSREDLMAGGTALQWVAASAVLAGLVGLAPAVRDQPSNVGCDAGTYRQFDFWLGEWEVVDARGTLVGRNHIEPVVGGCALTEHWQGVSGGTGTSLTAYSAADGRWRQMWVDGRGGGLALDGTWDADASTMRLTGRTANSQGSAVCHEITWQPRSDGTVRQRWRQSRDSGRTWHDAFDGIYRRVANH